MMQDNEQDYNPLEGDGLVVIDAPTGQYEKTTKLIPIIYLEEAIEALKFYASSVEYEEETKPVRNLRLVLWRGKVLKDKGKLARKVLKKLKGRV